MLTDAEIEHIKKTPVGFIPVTVRGIYTYTPAWGKTLPELREWFIGFAETEENLPDWLRSDW